MSHQPILHCSKGNDTSPRKLCQIHGLHATLWNLHGIWIIDLPLHPQSEKVIHCSAPFTQQGLPDPLALQSAMEGDMNTGSVSYDG